MTGVLLVVVVVLAMITLANAALLAAVIRRLRYVQELAVPSLPPLPVLGSSVASFGAYTVDGVRIDDSILNVDAALIAFLSTTCPACADLVGELASADIPKGALLVFVVDDTDARAGELSEKLREAGTLMVVGRDDPALAAFGGIHAFPTVLVVEQRRITAAGNRLEDVIPKLSGAYASRVA